MDETFRALSHTMRRRVLVAIVEGDSGRTEEFETAAFRPDDTDREKISLELHHTHLPTLDETGFVDWNRDAGTVDRGEDFQAIRPLLEIMDDHRGELPGDWP